MIPAKDIAAMTARRFLACGPAVVFRVNAMGARGFDAGAHRVTN
jgi:hypothetical protein